MLYRRTPLNPPRPLLRIVATAGATVAVMSTAACSSSSSGGSTDHSFPGSVAMPDSGQDAGSDAAICANGCGVMANPDASDDGPMGVLDGGGTDGFISGSVDGGGVVPFDSGTSDGDTADGPFLDGPVGVVPPDSGTD